jgi:hypothetical protein
LEVIEGGWAATGDGAQLAELIDHVAADWPHFGMPETGGARRSVQAIGRALAGIGLAPYQPADVLWELQWSARWEVERVLEVFRAQVLPDLRGSERPRLTVFVSEPEAQRHSLAATLRAELDAAGVRHAEVVVLNAFKAGLSWLREEVLPALHGRSVHRLRISYQPFRATSESALDLRIRWLQELFPGNELAAAALGVPLDAIEIVEAGEQESTYQARAFDAAGHEVGVWNCQLLSRTLPYLSPFPEEGDVCVTTGGIVIEHAGDQLVYPVETDLERFWRFWQQEALPKVIATIEQGGSVKPERQPFFGELFVEATVSESNDALGVREENESAAEALHEDIYFNALDALELLGTRRGGEKTSAPGAVVPLVRIRPGVTPHARVRLRAAPKRSSDPIPRVRVGHLRLEDGELELGLVAEGALSPQASARLQQFLDGQPSGASVRATLNLDGERHTFRVALPVVLGESKAPSGVAPPMDMNLHGDAVYDELRKLAGHAEVSAWIEEHSFEGRPIPAMALRAPAPGRYSSPVKEAILKPTCLIVARHHANEISSTNAALQLAHLCATEPEWRVLLDRLNIIVLPYENADGAALHARLTSDPAAATWKHHPARYNAVGFEFSEAFFDANTLYGESRARPALYRRWPADVIVDNHGVPSHEWAQPFAGFGSPPRFRVSYWIPQALIYGIVRYADAPEHPEQLAAALALRDAVSAAVGATELREWNAAIGASYGFWGQAREPERFPGEFHDGMLWHVSSGAPDPTGRGFNIRYPKTTVLSWVTEVNDETACDEHLARVARAHLTANRAMLDLLASAAPDRDRWVERPAEKTTLRVGRRRPLRIGDGGG